ncbi:hypothetical protein RN001_010905 [Aquatica leii]|uniref:3-demethylubiquinol 3-O-methyltransferase n=1 Tax=Aquatica leii TaxID=1421715 RepID=A0AAN7SGD4_9COLE|nr:hypothetical protein RN001_010905 [Aquatica leii]
MNSSTIDDHQMKIFDYYSSVWWNPNGPARGLYRASNFLFKYIKEVTSKHGLTKKGLLVLDAGCGGGLLAEPLVRHGYEVTGVDVNQTLLEVAQKHAQLDPLLKNLTYKLETIEDHAANNAAKYDIVVLTFVLQHIRHHEIILQNCAKLLKPGGLLFLTSAAKTYTSWFRISLLGAYCYKYVPIGSHNWYNFISARDVEEILKRSNCVVNETKGFYYSILSGNWDWYGNPDGGYYSMYATKM